MLTLEIFDARVPITDFSLTWLGSEGSFAVASLAPLGYPDSFKLAVEIYPFQKKFPKTYFFVSDPESDQFTGLYEIGERLQKLQANQILPFLSHLAQKQKENAKDWALWGPGAVDFYCRLLDNLQNPGELTESDQKNLVELISRFWRLKETKIAGDRLVLLLDPLNMNPFKPWVKPIERAIPLKWSLKDTISYCLDYGDFPQEGLCDNKK